MPIDNPGGGSGGSGNATAIQGRSVAATAPTNGQVYSWNSTNSDWEPSTVSGGSGNATQIQGRNVAATAPSDAQLFLWNSTNNDWEPHSISGDATITDSGALTLKNTGTAGTVGDASHSLTLTTDAQGRVTAATANAIQIAESQVTSLTTDLAARLVAANNLSDVANAATAATNLGLGTSSNVRHATLGLGGAVSSNDADISEMFDTATVSTDLVGASTPRAVERINDSRTISVTQTQAGPVGDGIVARRTNASPTLASGVTSDYAGDEIQGIVGGQGTARTIAAYSTHFDLAAAGGATLHAGFHAHVGQLQATGLVTDQAAYYVDAINSLIGTATVNDNPLTAGATTINLVSAGSLPASGNYYAYIDQEQVLVTGGQGTTTLTVSRGQNGTVANAHSQGSTIRANPTVNATGFLMPDTAGLNGAQRWGLRIGNWMSQHRGPLGIGGASTTTVPAAMLDVRLNPNNTYGPLGLVDVMRIASPATQGGTDDILERTVQGQVNTTGATTTALLSYGLTTNKTHNLDVVITWRRTGGTAGATNDGGALRCIFVLKFDGTTATQIGSTQVLYNVGSQVVPTPTLSAAFLGLQSVRVTGIANNNITWHATARLTVVGS